MMDMKVVMIDDVATTGGSVVNAIKSSKRSQHFQLKMHMLLVNRMEGADEALLVRYRSKNAFYSKHITNNRSIV